MFPYESEVDLNTVTLYLALPRLQVIIDYSGDCGSISLSSTPANNDHSFWIVHAAVGRNTGLPDSTEFMPIKMPAKRRITSNCLNHISTAVRNVVRAIPAFNGKH
jgi:hypothetical protein